MTPPTVDTYSPADSLLTVGGIPVTGFAEGDFIKIAYDGPAATLKAGEDGGVTVAKSLKRTGTITVTLRRGSPSNTDLGRFMVAFRNGASGAGYVDVFYENLNSPTSAHCERAFIEKEPDASDAADGGTSVWVIRCPIMDYVVAGAVA